jgi:Raf kinase inhibitor-like YbhB/YbcL family protein
MTAIAAKATLKVASPGFQHKGHIPEKYTCEGYNASPPLTIGEIPKGTISMVLIVEDPDAPGGTFDHWVVWNIQPTEVIGEATVPGIEGKNSKGANKYTGPCPPSGTHRYFFKVFALDTMLNLKSDADKKMVEQALHDHVLAYGEIMGLYKKSIANF